MPPTSKILMVRPAAFGFNAETAGNNYFQNKINLSSPELQQRALEEFDQMVGLLRNNDLDVIVIEDNPDPVKPDAIFPNNWLATYPGGILSVFPMYAMSRRLEKRDDIVQQLRSEYVVKDFQDWSEFEAEGRYLEGTGSMVTDHANKMIYSCISERTDLSVLEKFASRNGYQAIVFMATDREGRPVYHTNVVMMLGEKFSVLCEEAIEEEWELIAVRQLLESTGHTIVPISREQMHCFAGNMLELVNAKGEHVLVLSKTAYDSLRAEQRSMLEAYARLLPIAVPTIEQVEGGSVRCMIAELFLDKK